LLENPASGLFLAPGLGKTICTLQAFDILRDEKIIKNMLIVAKLRIINSTWPREISKWGFDYKVHTLHGKDKDKLLKEKADVYLINYEGLPWLYEQLVKKKVGTNIDMIVLDESSKIKNTRTQRFKLVKKMMPLFKRRHILTGSPAPNNLLDLFGQIFFLDGGEALGRYITHYRNMYFYPTGYMGYEFKLQDGAEEQIYDRVAPIVLRFGHDLIDMPPLQKRTVDIEFTKASRKKYVEMENHFITMIKDKTVTASNAGVKTQKLRQMANGSVYDENGKIVVIHEEKIEALKELIDELQGDPCLVGYEFDHDLKALQRHFPDVPYIGRGVNSKKQNKIEDDWNAGKLPVLFGQIATVAHGLNLQESGCNVVFYSLTWNLEDYEQFIQRVWRQGQKNTTIVHHLMMADSVDQDVMTVLEQKDATQRALLDALAKRTRQRGMQNGKGI